MTVRKVWLGSTGPFLYDDSILYIDEAGVISPDNQQAIATDGQIVIQSPPSSPVHAVRKQDLDDAVGDIAGLDARVDALEAADATLGTMSTQNANAVAITGGSVTNLTGFSVASGGGVINGPVGLNGAANPAYGTVLWGRTVVTGVLETQDYVQISNGLNVLGGGGVINGPVGLNGASNPAYGTVLNGANVSTGAMDCQTTLRVANQLVVVASVDGGSSLKIAFDKSVKHGISMQQLVNDAGPGGTIMFHNVAGGLVGYITSTATMTSYSTSSDARLKHAITPLTGALDVVRSLRPIAHRWKADDSPGVGFVAHEVAEIVDGVITGEKDAVDEEGKIIPQQIDYGKLVPWLTAALQELSQQVKTLTARVAELEIA